MKKVYFFSFIFVLSLFNFCAGIQKNKSINKLNWIEISTKNFFPQVIVDFDHPFYFERRIHKDKLCLELAFPGMTLKAFNTKKVIEKLKALKNIVKNVEIFYKKTPSPRVILLMSFVNKNDVLIRWSKMEDPNRLILDIFSKKFLNNIESKDDILLYAQNDMSIYGANKFLGNVINLGQPLNFNSVKKKIRILIDAGHGGEDCGAKGFFGLKEKDISLDIARRVKFLLKKNGYNVYLTRNKDKTLSLIERCELAGQLKANLCVSVHVNAVGGIEKVNGIESYYLNAKNLLPPFRKGGFLFVFNKKDKKCAKKADRLLYEHVKLSKKLAIVIQNSILKVAKNKKINIFNRGIKKEEFRILLSCQIPVALIEVGFLTNKKEAKRLSLPFYRKILAEGIGKGIIEYINLRYYK
ncbi:N-acetylmuramoyl-L-alanine amidase [Candidatus Babeliales bacterium]|nr:N-acetylmuramoyl-L-alanine amidase [Candidatus Babeliales bacterium]